MWNELAAHLALTPAHLAIAVAVVLGAGIVRGFSGFALSALIMASMALIIAPVELIAVCWIVELAASLLLLGPSFVTRENSLLAQADMSIVIGLMLGGIVGLPIGLMVTTTVDPDVSRAIALSLIVVLALLQLAKVRATFLATKVGLWLSGVVSGFATGIASIGGMVVALYVLSRDQEARTMRASLVAYLFLNSAVTLALYLWFPIMDLQAAKRGLVLVLPCLIGVAIGKWLFTPRLEPYYKPFCLVLLLGLATSGLGRMALGA